MPGGPEACLACLAGHWQARWLAGRPGRPAWLAGRDLEQRAAALWRPVGNHKRRAGTPVERRIAHIDAWGLEASMPECNVGWLAGLAGWLGTQAWLARMAG